MRTFSDSLQGYADEKNNSIFDAGDRVVFTVELDNSGSSPSDHFRLWENIDHHTVLAADHQAEHAQARLRQRRCRDRPARVHPDLALKGTIEVIDQHPGGDDGNGQRGRHGVKQTSCSSLIGLPACLRIRAYPDLPHVSILEKAAAINLLNSANVNRVFLVGFSDSASDSGGWLTKIQAINFINFMTPGGQTNYDAALTDAQTAFDFGHANATQTLADLLSDGEPNRPFRKRRHQRQ